MIRKKKFWIFLLLFLIIAAYYFFLNPHQQRSFFLSCPFYKITGYKCPGCGAQRAFHEMLHLHFLEAFRQNALFVVGISYFLLLFFISFYKEKYEKLWTLLIGNKTLLVLVSLVILFGVFRNL